MWLAAPTSPCGGLLATYRKYLRTCICKEVCPAMFTAALLTVAKTWRRLACAVTEAWKQAQCTRTMQHSAAVDEALPLATTRMDPENIMLSEANQKIQGPYDFTQTWDMKLKAKQMRKTKTNTIENSMGIWGGKGN